MRKNEKSEETIKILIGNFKQENPQLFNTLTYNRSDNNMVDNMTSMFSDTNNNHKHSTSTSKISIYNKQTDSSKSLLYTCKVPNNELAISHGENIKAIKTTNELVNSVLNVDITRIQSNDFDLNWGYEVTHAKDLTAMPNNSVVNSDYFTEESVHFNSMINHNNKNIKSVDIFPLRSIKNNSTSTSENTLNTENNTELVDDSKSVDKINDNISITKYFSEEGNITNSVNDNKLEHLDDSYDSDIAEALTQVIATYSENDSNEEIQITLTADKDLTSETVNEMHQHLFNDIVNENILTPPLQFKDF